MINLGVTDLGAFCKVTELGASAMAWRRKLRMALPCVGLDGISAGLQELRWDGVDVIHAFDVDQDLIPALQALHGRQAVERWNIGPDGNMLLMDVTRWEDVDLIVSGPPCPP